MWVTILDVGQHWHIFPDQYDHRSLEAESSLLVWYEEASHRVHFARWIWPQNRHLYVEQTVDMHMNSPSFYHRCCLATPEPQRLDLFENWLYWTSARKGDVYVQDKFGRDSKKIVKSNVRDVSSLAIYQPNKYNITVKQSEKLQYINLDCCTMCAVSTSVHVQ